MTFTRHQPPYLSDPQIIAFTTGVETPHSATLLKSSILPNERGSFALPSGLWVGETSGKRHFLQRANVTEPFVTDTGKVDLWQLFLPGDALTIVEPYLKLTVSSPMAAGDTATITVGSCTDVFTFDGGGGTAAGDAATELTEFINMTSPMLGQRLRAVQEGESIHLFSADGYTAHAIGLTLSGTGTIATNPGDGQMIINAPIGTIQMVSQLPESAGEITLTGAATWPVPVGAKIGVPCQRVLGFINKSIDMNYTDRCHVALVAAASGVREELLPYIDGDIKRQLPKLNIQSRF